MVTYQMTRLIVARAPQVLDELVCFMFYGVRAFVNGLLLCCARSVYGVRGRYPNDGLQNTLM